MVLNSGRPKTSALSASKPFIISLKALDRHLMAFNKNGQIKTDKIFELELQYN